MKTLPSLFLAAAIAAASLLTVSAASAFTFENKDSSGGATSNLAPGAQPYGDPADRLEPKRNFDSGSTSTYQQGGMTLKFGREPGFNEKYDSSNLFDPLRR